MGSRSEKKDSQRLKMFADLKLKYENLYNDWKWQQDKDWRQKLHQQGIKKMKASQTINLPHLILLGVHGVKIGLNTLALCVGLIYDEDNINRTSQSL